MFHPETQLDRYSFILDSRSLNLFCQEDYIKIFVMTLFLKIISTKYLFKNYKITKFGRSDKTGPSFRRVGNL